jgi:hypothetical protein
MQAALASTLLVGTGDSVGPGAAAAARLPLSLAIGSRGRHTPFELVLLIIVRGTPREYHYHLRSG